MKLQGKAALVTGGSRGIGKAIALAYAREGADVAIGYASNAAAAEDTVASIRRIGQKAISIKANTASISDIRSMVSTAVESLGRLDVFVSCGGVMLLMPFLDATEENFDAHFDVMVKGSFFGSQFAAQQMIGQGGGRIVLLASDLAFKAIPGGASYCSAKGAIVNLTRALASELAEHKVNVNAIAPALVETDMNADLRAIPELRDLMLSRVPVGRFARPEDIAKVAVFLASEDSDYLTGTTVLVDGGSNARG
ncbi:MAG: 3-oxoacyl-ACP reductase FabG [Chloroflexi bacterium]|nr:3-oxoacyl-ACP reductase FabG [Chloroflexota bacterium]